MKILIWIAVCLAVVSGCMTEQERREMVAREKAQELQRAKQRVDAARAATKLKIEKYWSDLAEHNYNYIQAKYASDMNRNRNNRRNNRSAIEDIRISNFIGPRLTLTEDERLRGLGLLETFGAKYLPNAYAQFERNKEAAEEIQQMFNESFPEPWMLRADNPKWNAYCKLLNGLCKARTKYHRLHDEICHYYVLHKIGAVTSSDLTMIDSSKICVWLLEENKNSIEFPVVKAELLDVATSAFAEKCMPETYAQYQMLKKEFDETSRLHSEVMSDMHIMDIVRFELGVIACCEKINYIAQSLTKISTEISALYMDHKTMDKDSETIASADRKMGSYWKKFFTDVTTFVKERANGPVIAVKSNMNSYYPSCDILRWHLDALGFSSSYHEGKKSKGGFEKLEQYSLPKVIDMGDTIDEISMSDYITDDQIIFVKNRFEELHGNSYVRYLLDGSYHQGDNPILCFVPFSCKRHWCDHAQECPHIYKRSQTCGIMKIASEVVLRDVKKQPWSHWTGWGDVILSPSPFELRLNEVSGYMPEIVVRAYSESGKGEGNLWRAEAK